MIETKYVVLRWDTTWNTPDGQPKRAWEIVKSDLFDSEDDAWRAVDRWSTPYDERGVPGVTNLVIRSAHRVRPVQLPHELAFDELALIYIEIP